MKSLLFLFSKNSIIFFFDINYCFIITAFLYRFINKNKILNKMQLEEEDKKSESESNESSENEEVFVSDDSEEQENAVEAKSEEIDGWKIGEEKFDENLKNYCVNFSSKVKPGPIEINQILNIQPYDIFSLFIDSDLLNHIGIQSDKYLNDIMNDKKRKKKPITSFKYYTTNIIKITGEEIRAFLAVIIIMGLKKFPKQSDHWQTNPLYLDPKISSIMPREMFKTLKTAFHIDDNNLFSSESFGKLHTVINLLNMRFKKYYILEQRITIDETMIPFKGAAGFIYYIPTKPTKIGIKMYSLCESKSGYCFSFKLDGGKKDKKPDFINSLVEELLSGLENKGYIVFFDSWFSSPLLLENLSKKKIACTAMIRKNRSKFISNFVAEFDKECDFASKNDVNILLWKDKSKKRQTIIKSISTIHSSELKIKEDDTGKIKFIPDAIKEYQTGMKGVDNMNQAIQYYKFHHRSYKWWEPIFYEFLEISINNAQIIYKKITNKNQDPQKFRENIIEGLLKGWSCHLPLKKTLIMQHNPKLIPTIPAINICYLHNLERKDYDNRDCVFCSTKVERKRTVYRCVNCKGNPHICPECFLEYHKQYVYN